MRDNNDRRSKKDCDDVNRRQFFAETWARLSGHRGCWHRGLRVSVSRAECALRTVAGRQCRQARPLSARLGHARCEFGIYIVHSEEGYFSLSAVCTHLGCLTAWKPELGIIACPCHGSKFKQDGKKIEGPAPKPLPWKRIWLNDDGDLLVDRSTDVPPLARDSFVRV